MTPESVKPWRGVRVLVLSPTPTHPQDFGNRKRIHRICKQFSDGGAFVTFVHYPAEMEWRDTKPRSAERAMRAAWPQYFTVAPTRPLHDYPKGQDHTIDEWWDPAIGNLLKWLFSVQSFDLFIVNYAWLSKALEFAPSPVFRILDTHDKVSGRRAMLSSLGLDAEFFHTTEEEEKIALDRAHLVWAIKKEECALFETMTRTPVVPMPHLDPLRSIDPPAPDQDGYLRVGVIGARNNVNRANITAFLREAGPIFRDSFAPVKIVIAGTVCDTLVGLDDPFVELRGPVGNVLDFYRTVDCVAVPMQASTGLKIKTGEALSLGLPVVSLAHAFEGYEAADALHVLPDFAAMARALADLSFEPRDRLLPLSEASRRAHAATAARIDEALVRTAERARRREQLVVVTVDSQSLVAGTVFNLVLLSAVDFLQRLSNVTVLVVRGSAADIAGNPGVTDRFRRIVVSQDLSDMEQAGRNLAELGIETVDAEQYLRRVQPRIVVADALHPALFAGCCEAACVISRPEMIAHSERSSEFEIPGRGFRQAFALAPALSRELAGRIAGTHIKPIIESCLWQSHAVDAMRVPDHSSIKTVAFLGDPESPAVGMAAEMAQSWKLKPLVVHGVGAERAVSSAHGLACLDAAAYLAAIAEKRLPLPRFAIDLSAGAPGLPLCRELLERLHVPLVASSGVAQHGSLGLSRLPGSVATEPELWQTLRWFALGPEESFAQAFEPVWNDLESRSGWNWLWRICKKTFEAVRAEAA